MHLDFSSLNVNHGFYNRRRKCSNKEYKPEAKPVVVAQPVPAVKPEPADEIQENNDPKDVEQYSNIRETNLLSPKGCIFLNSKIAKMK